MLIGTKCMSLELGMRWQASIVAGTKRSTSKCTSPRFAALSAPTTWPFCTILLSAPLYDFFFIAPAPTEIYTLSLHDVFRSPRLWAVPLGADGRAAGKPVAFRFRYPAW